VTTRDEKGPFSNAKGYAVKFMKPAFPYSVNMFLFLMVLALIWYRDHKSKKMKQQKVVCLCRKQFELKKTSTYLLLNMEA